MKFLEAILPTDKKIKEELHHIYADKDNFVATDTRIIAIKKHGRQDIEAPCLIINHKFPIKMEGNLITNEAINYTSAERYPSYKRFLTSEPLDFLERKDLDGLEYLYYICAKKGVVLDFVEHTKFYKLLRNLKFTRYLIKSPNLPIYVGNEEYTFIIMPLVLKD